MYPAVLPLKGPVLLITRDRRCAALVEQILGAERFAVVTARTSEAALAGAEERSPTVVLLDWAWDDEPGREELVYRLRPRRAGPRVIVIASDRDAPSASELSGVRAVVGRALDAEELVDLVWRSHHEVVEARKGR